jgi:hypothetical protein
MHAASWSGERLPSIVVPAARRVPTPTENLRLLSRNRVRRTQELLQFPSETAYHTLLPPSTTRFAPVTKDAASEQR